MFLQRIIKTFHMGTHIEEHAIANSFLLDSLPLVLCVNYSRRRLCVSACCLVGLIQGIAS
jgi:hypothetical protein